MTNKKLIKKQITVFENSVVMVIAKIDFFTISGKKQPCSYSIPPHPCFNVGRPGRNGRPIWNPCPINVVGIFLGHHGARHLFHYIRNSYYYVRLFRPNSTGNLTALMWCDDSDLAF